MADDKKEKKDAPKEDHLEKTAIEVGLLFLLLFAIYRVITISQDGFSPFVMSHFGQDSIIRQFFADPSWRTLHRLAANSGFLSFVVFLFESLRWVGYALSVFFVGLIVWLFRKTIALEGEHQTVLVGPSSDDDDPGKKRWKRVITYCESENPSDWRLAILEADIILDEILDASGYRGETLGDKLKSIEASDMDTLNDAWEAHKIRNAIAHEGEGFLLSAREARRVIGLYENVFREFEFI